MGKVLKWAKAFATQVTGRARCIVTRVLALSTDPSIDEQGIQKTERTESSSTSTSSCGTPLLVETRDNLQKGVRFLAGNLQRGVRFLAAVFLLEAAVQSHTGAGSGWSQRIQGGGQADLLEMADGQRPFTEAFYEHGWVCATPGDSIQANQGLVSSRGRYGMS